MSESKFDDKKRYKLLEYYKSFKYISKFSGAIVGGRAHAEYLISLGMKNNNIQIGYDIVDNLYFYEMTRKIRINNKRNDLIDFKIPKNNYFICVTRFLPRKNLEMLIKSYSNYRMKIENPWDLVICGTGIEYDNIQNLIKSLNLNSHIHLPGFVSYSDIVFWYANASCLVHPALSEQWGLVVNEACASQLPVICSDKVGACHELVFNGVNGYKFDPTNSIELENRLSEIHMLGEEKLVEMGINSYKLVSEKCSPNNFKDACIRLINN
jgi:glycosyltransferase involved in cell wall biosynthesis